MSRIANKPVVVPKGVDVNINGSLIRAKGPKGEMTLDVHPTVSVAMEENELNVSHAKSADVAMAGTMRALLNNIIQGVSNGFEKKLETGRSQRERY